MHNKLKLVKIKEPFFSIAFQNICGLGYSHVSIFPCGFGGAFGIEDFSRLVEREKGWSGAGRWLGGGI